MVMREGLALAKGAVQQETRSPALHPRWVHATLVASPSNCRSWELQEQLLRADVEVRLPLPLQEAPHH